MAETREQLGARIADESKVACLAEADGPSCCCCPACCHYCREWAVDFTLGVKALGLTPAGNSDGCDYENESEGSHVAFRCGLQAGHDGPHGNNLNLPSGDSE